MIKKVFFAIILLASDKPSIQEKIQYFVKLIATFAPIAYLLDQFNIWFIDNTQFFSSLIITLLINVVVGGWYHKVNGTFSWSEFFKKNIQMWVILLLIYPILEFFSTTAGENIVGEGFRIVIQLATLLYPASKVLKNGYILSNKKFPPSFIMERIYNFEKSGKISDLVGEENMKSPTNNYQEEPSEEPEI